MSHFNKKSLIFYAGAIGSVVSLFSVVTAYGEAKLKPPKSITGSYQLQISPQPDCPNPQTVDLNLEQSGIFLTATLQAQQGRQAIPQPHALAALSGQWQSPSLTLIGDSSALNLCSDPSKATLTKRPGNVRLQIKGNFAADPVTGKIMAGDNSPPLSFSGHKKNSSASTNSSKKPAPKK